MAGYRIRISGTVQGVGFRPLIWRLANELGVTGAVRNDGAGVTIEAWADEPLLDALLQRIRTQLPPLAKLDAMERHPLEIAPRLEGFVIEDSAGGRVTTALAADAASCERCLAEISDRRNRRYRYAFTTCTHCGPRFSVATALPFDRANTSMSAFKLCAACEAEYGDPEDRRFHAQTNACPHCGPRLWLTDSRGVEVNCEDVIEYAAGLIRDGNIIAIKGLGGFHLACDATREATVARLRRLKGRPHKPFALLARDLNMIGRFARVTERDRELLQSAAAPIVLLSAAGESLAGEVAPGQDRLGFALPATPLHRMLMDCLHHPIVFTSGNLSDEPLCADNDEALQKLASLADFFLFHDRDIVNRLDDSVVVAVAGEAAMLRRARGYAPAALVLPPGFRRDDSVLAMGAELKNTFCLVQHGQAIVSPHLGDLKDAAVLSAYHSQLTRFQQLYRHSPTIIAVDAHHGYLSSQTGHRLASEGGLALVEVPHHHAHAAAVLAEHGWPLDGPPVLAAVLDGLGMGEAGELWGGEFLLVDYIQYRRLASVSSVALLGGEQAMRQPWRNTLAHLLHCFNWRELSGEFSGLELMDYLRQKPLDNLQQMMTRGVNSPPCSSLGRLFDAVAAAVGVCRDHISYEGQAAMELETLANRAQASASAYPVDCLQREGMWRLDWTPLWRALLHDLRQGQSAMEIAARFHRSLVQAMADLLLKLCRAQGVQTVVLSGGVMQNRWLRRGLSETLRERGIEVLCPNQFPAHDGGISLGQVMVAMARRQRCCLPS